MMPRHDDDDRPKRSWREIDNQKDRSKHRQDDRPALTPQKNARAKSASLLYKSKLNAFFEGGGEAPAQVKEKLQALKGDGDQGEERQNALKAIKEAKTSAEADAAATAYLAQFEIPPDFDVLSQLLLCADEQHLTLALTELLALLAAHRVPSRTALLEQRLRRVKTLADDAQLQSQADDLLRQLRLFS